jgi:Domain of unknown function (DUF6531)
MQMIFSISPRLHLRVFICSFLLIAHSLVADDGDFEVISKSSELLDPQSNSSLAAFEREPSSIVEGCVNVITGDFFESDADLILAGHDPLTVERSYCSSDNRIGSLLHSWVHNHWMFVFKEWDRNSSNSILVQNGSQIYSQGLKS